MRTLGILWMIVLWSWTSPMPLSHYLQNLLLPRRFLTTSIVILFFLQLFGYFHFTAGWLSDSIIPYAGNALFFIGIILASWAKFIMGRNWGEPGQHDIKRQHDLVTSGPFAISRNPIYVGLLLIFFGFELTVSSWFVVGIIPVGYLIYTVVKKEELLLDNHFGKTYVTYKKRVPRFL